MSIRNLLSFLSQLSTLAFQSHVCFSMSNAKPEGQVICFSPARVHLCVCTTTTTVHVFHYQSFRRIKFSFSFQVSWFFFPFHNPMLTSSNEHYSNGTAFINNAPRRRKKKLEKFVGDFVFVLVFRSRERWRMKKKKRRERKRKDYLNIICK